MPKATEIFGDGGFHQEHLLIDNWSRLMDFSVDNKLSIHVNDNDVICLHKGVVISDEFFADYESPQDAVMFSIARALVKLKEGKFDD